ncbi:MAG TPA: MFS transporter [Bacillota bacterium]|nr:MFS transporter [Bacillota bacterium]HQC48723.1 MFS transporter [Bacillota bacterium]
MDETGNLTEGSKLGFVLTASVMGVICIIGAAIHYFTTKERVHQAEESDERIPFKEVVRMLLHSDSFVRNTIYIVLYGCSNLLLLTSLTYYATYVLGSTSAATSVQAVYLAVSLVMSVFVSTIDKRLGRRKTMMFGTLFYIVGKFWFIFNPTNKMALYVNAAGVAVGVAISFVMFNTNRNNIVDLIEAKEGHRLDSMVSTVDNLASKLAQSLVTWLIGFSLARAGYNAELAAQPPAVIKTLNVLLGIVPMIFGIAMFFVVKGFKIEEEIKELNEKRMKLSS